NPLFSGSVLSSHLGRAGYYNKDRPSFDPKDKEQRDSDTPSKSDWKDKTDPPGRPVLIARGICTLTGVETHHERHPARICCVRAAWFSLTPTGSGPPDTGHHTCLLTDV